jgi:HD-like signal output (HDOD) protein
MTTNGSPAHRFLIAIADELSSGDVNFPTFLEAAMKIRLALNNPELTVEALSRLVVTEPLVSAKVIRLANSAALNPGGAEISDVRNAVVRVGFSSIRSLAIAVAIEQLMLQKEMGDHLDAARQLWQHSLDVAALSFVLARRLTRINPHEAMFAGLVHDIGYFYLLSRISRHPEVVRDREELARLLFEWHASIGHAVLSALEAPAAILDAVSHHEIPCDDKKPLTLAHLLQMANRLAEHRNPFAGAGEDRPAGDASLPESVAEIVAESRDELDSVISALGR